MPVVTRSMKRKLEEVEEDEKQMFINKINDLMLEIDDLSDIQSKLIILQQIFKLINEKLHGFLIIHSSKAWNMLALVIYNKTNYLLEEHENKDWEGVKRTVIQNVLKEIIQCRNFLSDYIKSMEPILDTSEYNQAIENIILHY